MRTFLGFLTIASLVALVALHGPQAMAEADNFGVSTPPPPEINMTAPENDTINKGANQNQAAQLAAAAHNEQVALLLIMECQKQKKNELCFLGMLAWQQAQALRAAAMQSQATASASTNKKNTGDNATKVDGSTLKFTDPRIKEAVQTLKAAGITVKEDGTVKMPDGSVKPASAFSTAKGMASAGLDPASLEEAQKLADNVKAENYNTQSTAVAEGGGGGSLPSQGGSYETATAKGHLDKQRLMAGKTVMFDGEPIGVRGNDIFQMVHAAYEKKRANNHFIDSEQAQSAKAAESKPMLPPGFK